MPSLGFGLERIAWLALRRPVIAGALTLLLLGLALFGATQLRFDEGMRNVFASESEVYTAYVDATRRFVDPENELLLLVEGEAIAEPATFRRLQDLHFELQLTEGVGSVFSLFSLREAPNADGDAPPVVNSTDAGLTPDLLQAVRDHPLLGAKLVDAHGETLMMVVTPDRPLLPIRDIRTLKEAIEGAATSALADAPLTITTTGFPVIRTTILDILRRDQIVLNAAGATLGFLMSLLVFRSVTAAFLTSMPAIFAGFSVIGIMGFLGLPITVMTNIVPAVVMILGYADGMHLSFAFRKARDEGASVHDAEMSAQRQVGGACVLAAVTTSIAFAALAISDVSLVSSFGLTGAVATTLGAIAVLVLHALLALLIGRFWSSSPWTARNFLNWLRLPSGALGEFSVRYARPVALAAVLVAVTASVMHYSVPPQHSVREHLPPRDPANAALGRIDRAFDGIFPIQVVLRNDGQDALSPEGLARVGALHEAVEGVDRVTAPISLWSIVRWFGGAADEATAERVRLLVEQLPQPARQRFINTDGDAIITGNTIETSTAETRPIVDAVNMAARAAVDDDATVTGMTVITVLESARTIDGLNLSLTLSVIANLFVIAFAFRDWRIGVLSFLPNIIPIMAVGAVLFIAGRGMQFTGVIALTVAFGIAVDDTVHFLNRYRLIPKEDGDAAQRLVAAARHVGPALFATTLVIITGMASTLTSGLPTIALFGQIAAGALAVALIGDLLFLPALMLTFGRRIFAEPASLPTTDTPS